MIVQYLIDFVVYLIEGGILLLGQIPTFLVDLVALSISGIATVLEVIAPLNFLLPLSEMYGFIQNVSGFVITWFTLAVGIRLAVMMFGK